MAAAVLLVRTVCALVALVLLVIIAERMMPLRSIGRDRWEWDLRPAGRFPGIDRAGWIQVVVFTVAGAGVGGVLRYLAGVRKPRRLSTVLGGGVTRSMTAASSTVFDSESAADIYAATWLRDAPVRARALRGPTAPALMVRRVLRRGYIPALFLVTVLLTVAVVPYTGVAGRTVAVLVWAVLASAVWRATRLGIPGQWRWRAVVLGAAALVGAAVQWLPGAPEHPLQTVAATGLAVLWCALVRGRPRTNGSFTSVEIGLGAPVPVGMLTYWLSGGLAVLPAVASALAAATGV